MLVGLFFLFRPYVSKHLRNKQDNELNKFFPLTKCVVLYGFILLSFLGIVTIAVDGLQERFIQRQLSAWVFADWWAEDPITSYRPARRFLDLAEQPIALKEIPLEIVGALITQEAKLKDEEAKPDPLCEYIGELDLSRRQLNYAYFYGSQFRCVKLESAKLHGANLFGAELHGANLQWAELHSANLQWAELHSANLSEAELHGADLSETELYGANLRFAELHGANLTDAELHGANLLEAELHGADLRWTELHDADLSKTKLYNADLRSAELHGVDLYKAELHGANLFGAELHGVNLFGVRWYKPKDWDNIIISIRDSLKKRGLTDGQINNAVSRIEEISTTEFGFIPPTTPVATDCVFHSGQGPFTEWPTPAEGCDSEFISAVVEVACQNQWTAKDIVNRAIYKRARYRKVDINLINALLNKDCSSLNPYRKALNDEYKELNRPSYWR